MNQTTTCDACGRRYEFTSVKDRCPVCCPKPDPDDAFDDNELIDDMYDDGIGTFTSPEPNG